MAQPTLEGLVLRVDAKVCHVEVDGRHMTVPLAGKLFEVRGHEKQPLAVGDRVVLRMAEEGAAIDAILPRETVLLRRASSESAEKAQLVAANISLVVAVGSIREPKFQPEVIDGILAAAARERIKPVLAITKADLAPPGEAEQWAALYRRAGYEVFVESTAPGHETRDSIAALGRLMHENRTAVVGLSGVGKSTLLNAIVPGLALKVGSLNASSHGRHTTTHTELVPLPDGGHVLDTPGIRAFHLFHVGSQELQFLLPEIGALLPQCAFRDCLHLAGAKCAVMQALDRGDIAASRYESYRKMVTEALEAEKPPKGQVGADRGRRRSRPD